VGDEQQSEVAFFAQALAAGKLVGVAPEVVGREADLHQ